MRSIQYFLEVHLRFVMNTLGRISSQKRCCGEYNQAVVRRIQYFLEVHLRFVVNTLRRISSQKRFVVNTLRR